MKKVISKLSFTMIVALFFILGCKKEDNSFAVKEPLIETIIETDSNNFNLIGGKITKQSDVEVVIKSRGICYSESNNIPTIQDSKTIDGSGYGDYFSYPDNVIQLKTYYFRAYASSPNGVTFYGDVLNFTANKIADIITLAPTDIKKNSVVLGGNITKEYITPITSRGVCYSKIQNPTINDSITLDGSGIGSYTSNINGLESNTFYYVRAYAKSSLGITYGNEIKFKTFSDLPEVDLKSVTVNGATTANAIGDVLYDGGSQILARGFCYGVNPNPTIADSKINSSINSTGQYNENIVGLLSMTNYYVRAYATNVNGTNYSVQILIKTWSNLPELKTISTTSISFSKIIAYGELLYDGSSTILSRGFCYSTTTNPTISNSKVTNSSNLIGNYNDSLTGLLPNTVYYLRAFATNVNGISYGNEISFKTQSLIVGDYYGGGIVYYIAKFGDIGYSTTVQHGLIAATQDINPGTKYPWVIKLGTVGSTDTLIGKGNSNTTKIVTYQGNGVYGAKLCNDLTLNGYNDWFLPSKGELRALLNNVTYNASGATGTGGVPNFTSTSYLTSSEYNSTQFYTLSAPTFAKYGVNLTSPKNATGAVRPIRSF